MTLRFDHLHIGIPLLCSAIAIVYWVEGTQNLLYDLLDNMQTLYHLIYQHYYTVS